MAARNHAWRLGALSLVLLVATSCRDVTSPTALLVPELRQNAFACEDPSLPGCDAPPPPPSDPPPPPPPTQSIVYSAGFYMGSDGYYYWDGRPPVGDLDPARITDARAEAHAPDMSGNGWVKGYMVYSDGDEAKISLTVDAWQGSTRLIGPAAPVTDAWTPCAPVGGFGHCQNDGAHPL